MKKTLPKLTPRDKVLAEQRRIEGLVENQRKRQADADKLQAALDMAKGDVEAYNKEIADAKKAIHKMVKEG